MSGSELDPGAGDRPAAERVGARVHRRRRLGAGVTALVVLLVVGLAWFVSLGTDDDGAPEPAPPVGGSWRDLAPLPIAPRWGPVVAWTGEEVLVVGGGTSSPCPASAACTGIDRMARDGAAYDPDTDTWRTIADAPVDVGYWFRPAFVAGRLVLFGDQRWWAYDPATDAWSDLPEPARRVRDTGALATSGDGFVRVLARSGDLLALNVARATWATVPLGSPDGFVRDTVVGDHLFSGHRETDPDGRAVVDLGAGRLVETGQTGPFRHWTGERLVELDLQVAPEGTPYGGRLDPATGEWTPLPNAPDLGAHQDPTWSLVAADGPLIAGWGYAYDDRTGRWTTLGQPSDADADDGLSAVWVDGDLVVVGGHDGERLTRAAWRWSPDARS